MQYISSLRREYDKGKLNRHNLPLEPIILFKHWLKQAFKARISDPTAMVLATVDKKGQPYQRVVLMKHYDEHGLIFYTNLKSRKSTHINLNPYVSLLFPWHALDRQVIIIGIAKRLPKLKIVRYFYSRPRNSQISAWLSKQSSRISTRDVLESNFFSFKKKFQNKKILCPNFWGGYRVSIKQIEFWQGRKHRLNDRFIYQRINKKWKIDRLAP